MARLAGTGHGVEPPRAFAGLGVISIDKAAHSVFTTRHSHNDFVLHQQGCNRKHVSLPVVGSFHVPYDIAGFHVERQYVRVERGHEKLVAQRGKSAIHHAATRLNLIGQVALIAPDRAPGPGIQRECTVVLPRSIQDSVNYQWRGFKLAERRALKHPLRSQIVSVGGINLVESAVPPAFVVPGVSQPVPRLMRSLNNAVGCYLRRHWHRKGNKASQRGHKRRSNKLHLSSPRKLVRYASKSRNSSLLNIASVYVGMSDRRSCMTSRKFFF